MSKTFCFVVSLVLALSFVLVPNNTSAQTSSAFCYTFTRDLTVGSTGAAVTALQTIMRMEGFAVQSTGYFGTLTKAAVIGFQTKYGIAPAAGYVGVITRALLNARYGCTPITTIPSIPSIPGCTLTGAVFSTLTGQSCNTLRAFDYNSDGWITQADTEILLKVATGSLACPTGRTCDVNGSGTVNTTDALALAKYTTATPAAEPVPTPSITVTSPSGGQEVAVGSSLTVRWLATGLSSTDTIGVIRLRTSAGSEVNLINAGTPNDGQETISIPSTLASGIYTLEVKSLSSVIGASAPFNLYADSGAESSPTGTLSAGVATGGASASTGETLTVPYYTQVTISWSAENVTGCALKNTSGDYFVANGLSGSKSIRAKTNTVIRMNCLDVNDNVVLTKTVNINIATGAGDGTPVPSGTLSVSETGSGVMASNGGTLTTTSGKGLTIAWAAQNVTGCALKNTTGQFFAANGTSGSKAFYPTQSTTIRLNCLDANEAVVFSTTVGIVIGTTPPPTEPLRITTTSPLPSATVGTPYSTSITSMGGTGNRALRVSAGLLPPGIVLGPSACPMSGCEQEMVTSFSGTPTTAGTYTFTVQVSTSGGQSTAKSFSLTVAPATSGTPSGEIQLITPADGGTDITVESGSTVFVDWSVRNVSTCTVYGYVAGNSTPVFSGTGLNDGGTHYPTQTTTYTLTCLKDGVQVINKSAIARVVNTTTTSTALKISTYSLPQATVGTAYSAGVTSTGGTGTRSWRLSSGTLPPGIVFNTAACTGSTTCAFSGTPTTAGTYTFTVQVNTTGGQSIGKSLTIAVAGNVLGANASIPTQASERACSAFSANLSRGASGPAVIALQEALTKDGEAVEATGYFGPLTTAAVKAFQEKYAGAVLAPAGLTSGTGFVGAATRAQLNTLFGCSS